MVKNQNNKITIITATLNEEFCIDSYLDYLDVINEKYGYMAILIDGGSSDNTCSIIRKHKNIRLIEAPGTSIYQAWNIGLNNVTDSYYVVFLGVGDKISPTAFCQMYDKFGISPPDVIYGDLKTAHGQKLKLSRKFINLNESCWGHLPFPHSGTLFSLNLFNRFGLFDESFKIAGDLEWVLRIVRKSYISNYSLNFYYAYGAFVEMRDIGISENKNTYLVLVTETFRAHKLNEIKVSLKRRIVLYWRLIKIVAKNFFFKKSYGL